MDLPLAAVLGPGAIGPNARPDALSDWAKAAAAQSIVADNAITAQIDEDPARSTQLVWITSFIFRCSG